jgi:hypothetical protein
MASDFMMTCSRNYHFLDATQSTAIRFPYRLDHNKWFARRSGTVVNLLQHQKKATKE